MSAIKRLQHHKVTKHSIVSFSSIKDLKDKEEHVDDVEVECNRSDDVVFLAKCQLSVLAADDQLRVVNYVEAETNDSDHAVGQVHGWTDQDAHDGSHDHYERQGPNEGTASREVRFGLDGVDSKSNDHCSR